jgi:hypothetical protein
MEILSFVLPNIPIWALLIIGLIALFIIWKIVKFALIILVIIVIFFVIMMGLDFLGVFKVLQQFLTSFM